MDGDQDISLPSSFLLLAHMHCTLSPQCVINKLPTPVRPEASSLVGHEPHHCHHHTLRVGGTGTGGLEDRIRKEGTRKDRTGRNLDWFRTDRTGTDRQLCCMLTLLLPPLPLPLLPPSLLPPPSCQLPSSSSLLSHLSISLHHPPPCFHPYSLPSSGSAHCVFLTEENSK